MSLVVNKCQEFVATFLHISISLSVQRTAVLWRPVGQFQLFCAFFCASVLSGERGPASELSQSEAAIGARVS